MSNRPAPSNSPLPDLNLVPQTDPHRDGFSQGAGPETMSDAARDAIGRRAGSLLMNAISGVDIGNLVAELLGLFVAALILYR